MGKFGLTTKGPLLVRLSARSNSADAHDTGAQTPAPETYSESFWDRPRLTGDWVDSAIRQPSAASGALVPVNTAGILPSLVVDDPATALMQLTFTQFLAPWFGVAVGKFNGLQADNNAFAHDFRTQFLNLGQYLWSPRSDPNKGLKTSASRATASCPDGPTTPSGSAGPGSS